MLPAAYFLSAELTIYMPPLYTFTAACTLLFLLSCLPNKHEETIHVGLEEEAPLLLPCSDSLCLSCLPLYLSCHSPASLTLSAWKEETEGRKREEGRPTSACLRAEKEEGEELYGVREEEGGAEEVMLEVVEEGVPRLYALCPTFLLCTH